MSPRTASWKRASARTLQRLRHLTAVVGVVMIGFVVLTPTPATASGSDEGTASGQHCTIGDGGRRSVEVVDDGEHLVLTSSDRGRLPSPSCPRQPMPAVPLPLPVVVGMVGSAAGVGAARGRRRRTVR